MIPSSEQSEHGGRVVVSDELTCFRRRRSLFSCPHSAIFPSIGSVLKRINSWIPGCIYPTGMRGAEFTYCQIIICFQQTLLLPEICTMWFERREDSFCNMFPLLAVCQGYYRERKRKTSICDHMSNACPSLWLPGNSLCLIPKLGDLGKFSFLDRSFLIDKFL